jgi:hypothetical protein
VAIVHSFLVRRVFGFHPVLFLAFHLVTAIVAVLLLAKVATARGRSPMWAAIGVLGIPGLVIGLLILIALPVQPSAVS